MVDSLALEKVLLEAYRRRRLSRSQSIANINSEIMLLLLLAIMLGNRGRSYI
jgi:hypothetical protein